MKRSEMSESQKSVHTQKVCEMVNKEHEIRIKKTNDIKRKIARLNNQLEKANENFNNAKEDICIREGVSELFITRIIFGKNVSNELEDELISEENPYN